MYFTQRFRRSLFRDEQGRSGKRPELYAVWSAKTYFLQEALEIMHNPTQSNGGIKHIGR